MSRRAVLAAGGALGVTGLAGCTDAIDDVLGDAAAAAVTNRHATPAAFYGGEDATEGSRAESDYAVEYVPVTVSGEYEGLESSVDLSAYVTTSRLLAQNHNSSRSNRTSPIRADSDADDDGLDDGLDDESDPLSAYLGGEATIGERFVLTVPDARIGDGGESLLAELTPDRVLRYLSDQDIEGDDLVIRKRPGRKTQLSADITWPYPLGTGPYNPAEQLLALGYEGDVNNATVALEPRVDDTDDTDDSGSDDVTGVYVADGRVRRFASADLGSWGDVRTADGIEVSPTVLLSVGAQPEDCPEPMPALLYVRRFRRGEQYGFAGGWVVDDNALYANSTTILVAEGVPELRTVDHDRSVEEMRRTITSGLTRERSRHGSLVYDGELGEAALSFLPSRHRTGETRAAFIKRATASVDGRNPQTGKEIKIALRDGPTGADEESLQTTIVPIDCPLVQVTLADGCEDCEECKCTTNLVPAVNTISSR